MLYTLHAMHVLLCDSLGSSGAAMLRHVQWQALVAYGHADADDSQRS